MHSVVFTLNKTEVDKLRQNETAIVALKGLESTM